jgi:hypothetical protein
VLDELHQPFVGDGVEVATNVCIGETRAGHGAGKPTSKRIEEAADQWALWRSVWRPRSPRLPLTMCMHMHENKACAPRSK